MAIRMLAAIKPLSLVFGKSNKHTIMISVNGIAYDIKVALFPIRGDTDKTAAKVWRSIIYLQQCR